MQIIKTTILFGLMIGILSPTSAQQEATDYTSSTEETKVVLALNRLETKKSAQLKEVQSIYDNKGYTAAADILKSNIATDEADMAVWSKLANAARLNANYEEAAFWYQKVTQDGPLPQDLLHYAQALQATGNCEEAVKWFNLYNSSPADNKVAFINNCNDVNNFSNFEEVKMKSLEGLNTNKLDFSARPFKEGIVFTSNRGANIFSKLIDRWTNNSYTDLFYSEKSENGYAKPTVLKSAVNGKFHDGVATFSNDDTIMYFTRNDNKNKSKNSVLNLKVYEATNSESVDWSTAMELPFNGEGFSTCHPTVSEDGTTMYFSSDRPGGYGGMDIYKVTLADGSWTTPQNVGPSINSAGNEIFPFITTEGDLAFSSNGHPGMGGLDVYVARQEDATSNNWNRIVNAGKPFNSIKDDFGFYMNGNNTSGYLSSGRIDEQRNDDIYEWKSDEKVEFFPELAKEQIFCVVDEKTGTPILNAAVNVEQSEKGGKNEVELITDNKGQFALTVWSETKLELATKKEGFVDGMTSMDFENTEDSESSCIEVKMKKVDAVYIVGRVVNTDKKDSPIANAKITLVNKCNDKEETFTSNKNGEFNIDVPCNCDYSLVGEKSSFVMNRKTLLNDKIKCNEKNEIVIPLKEFVKPEVVIPMFMNKELTLNTIIPLDNINYDYNKSTIRSDAAIELDKVVEIMKKYPLLKIELGSHTDARGSSKYNQVLSAARAQSAVRYLTSKGVSIDRTTARGYGESILLNKCVESVKCSDKQHEFNRRTEIKVINF